MVIAAQNQRWFVGRADGNLATDVGNLLRWPDGTSAFSVATASLYLDGQTLPLERQPRKLSYRWWRS